VRLARPRRPKIVCSPSYADFRSRANTTRRLDFDHMMRWEHTRNYKDRQEPPKNKITFDVLYAKELMQKL
jgi:hypothetical protein